KQTKEDTVAHSWIIITTFAIIAAASGMTKALAESGTGGERDAVISQYKAFEVVKRPGQDSCYVKSYGGNGSKMAISYDGTFPIIVSRFDRGIEGDLQYWVDNGAKHTIPASKTKGAKVFALPTEMVSRMKAGHILYVRVKPAGEASRTQKFSLMGFTAATRVLADSKCRNDKGIAPPPNLEVKLTRNSDGAAVVSGSTILPDGMNLLISLHTDINGYYAQDTARVHSGTYESDAFSDRGRPLPAGRYTVSISSPLMYLQPLSVQHTLGASGDGIPKSIRQPSPYGDSYVVDYSVSRNLN
ncbi:MAG TPA: hypothetical protein VFL97_03430, partial [Nitrococcus sp.]|nr:hypothetical protein [Nitrococcus sp.]